MLLLNNRFQKLLDDNKLFSKYRVRQISYFLENALKKSTEYYLRFRLIMENNLIQMAASAGHAVAYTIFLKFLFLFESTILPFRLIKENNFIQMAA